MNVLVRDDNAPVAIHPPGFRVKDHRKAIPIKTKLEVVIRWGGRCARCGERLNEVADTDFDHDPALASRPWSQDAGDFVPAQLDPLFLFAAHRDCHSIKTHGRGGSKRISTADSDVGRAGKVRRLTKSQEEFRAKLLAKSEGTEPEATERKRKPKWPSRPFPKRKKVAS